MSTDNTKKKNRSYIKFFGSIIFVLFLIFIIVVAVFGTKKIRVTQVGIKTNMFSFPPIVKSGVSTNVLGPGIAFFIPYIQKVDVIDIAMKKFEMAGSKKEQSLEFGNAVEIRTTDESIVIIDVSVLYQVDRKLAYKYWMNVKKKGDKKDSYLYEILKTIENEVRSELGVFLGKLGRDDFYNNSPKRENLAVHAKDSINQRFGSDEIGINIIDILVRDFHYSKDYEDKILEKALVNEEIEIQEVRKKVEEANKYLKAKVLAPGEAKIKVILEEGNASERQIFADANLYLEKKKAAGDLLIKQATAIGRRELVKAFRGLGGKNAVGLEMAKVLEGAELIILDSSGKDGVNPLDLNKIFKLYNLK